MAYQHTLTLGTVLIEDFRILGHLGSGGFANTYLALDLTLGREVAIKEYFPSELAIRANTEKVEVKSKAQEAQFQWALRRFVREAKTLAKFRHPSVVRVFRVFNANDTAYIVLEFVRGSNMETWLKGLGRRPTQDELDVLLSSLLDALEVVHSAGILHRDIKPANIYIRAADQTPVLLDFGAARYASGDYAGTTAAIVSKGYSPHEAYATDSRLQGPWTDIYGLAATVYRALTGSAPLESTTRVLEDNCIPAVSIPGITGEYREDFLRAIDDGLRVMPRDRPQSIGEWRQRLMPDSSTNPRVLDANGDPTTIQEWRPISDLQSDAPTMDRPWSGSRGSSGGAAPSSGAKQSGGSSPSRGAVVGHSRVQMPKSGSGGPSRSQSDMAGAGATAGLTGAGTTRLMDRADDDIVDGRTSGGRSAAPTPEPRRSRSSGIVSRSSEPVSNRTFVIGIVFLLAGTAALAGQWLITRKPSQPAIEIAAPAPETARNAGGAVSSPPDETKRQREAAERAAAEAARLAEVERRKAEADRVALANAEAEKRAAEAEAQRVAAAEQRAKEQAEKKAESDRIARETAEAERLAAAAEAERKAAAEKRAREIAAADRRAKEEAERKAEAEKRAREVAAAERQAKEEAERKAEAEKRARELAEAERRSKEEAERRAAAEKRARELAEAERRSKEEAERRLAAEKRARELAEAERRSKEEAERKAAAEKRANEVAVAAASQTDSATEVGSVGSSEGLDGRKLAALTGQRPDDEAGRRASYLKDMQAALKTSQCYSGDLTGDVESTKLALTSFETAFNGDVRKIDVASASSNDFEQWLGWFWRQESFSCRRTPVPDRRPAYEAEPDDEPAARRTYRSRDVREKLKRIRKPQHQQREVERPSRVKRATNRPSRPSQTTRKPTYRPSYSASRGGGGSVGGGAGSSLLRGSR